MKKKDKQQQKAAPAERNPKPVIPPDFTGTMIDDTGEWRERVATFQTAKKEQQPVKSKTQKVVLLITKAPPRGVKTSDGQIVVYEQFTYSVLVDGVQVAHHKVMADHTTTCEIAVRKAIGLGYRPTELKTILHKIDVQDDVDTEEERHGEEAEASEAGTRQDPAV